MRCQYCGYENQPGHNRCAGCGKPVTGEKTPHRKNMVLFGAALLLMGLVGDGIYENTDFSVFGA